MCYFCTPFVLIMLFPRRPRAYIHGTGCLFINQKSIYVQTHACLFRVCMRPALEWSGKREKERKKFMPWRIFRGRRAGWETVRLENCFKKLLFGRRARSVAQSKVNQSCMRLSPRVSHPEQNPLQQSRLISQQQQLPDRERERISRRWDFLNRQCECLLCKRKRFGLLPRTVAAKIQSERRKLLFC
jgi:hypothetical protein